MNIFQRVLYVKDLRIFHDRDISKIVIVDYDIQYFYNQQNNGLPIVPFYDYIGDTELLRLEMLLDYFENINDFRSLIHKYYNCQLLFGNKE